MLICPTHSPPHAVSHMPPAGPQHPGAASPQRKIPVLEVDSDLGRTLAPSQSAEARASLTATVADVAPGPWQPFPGEDDGAGVLVLEGVLLREIVVSGARSAEILAAGDLLAPSAPPVDALLPRYCELTALTAVRVAVLDSDFVRRASQWPGVLTGIAERTARRVERLGTQHAIVQVTRVDLRLEGLFWHLAERFGRVTPDGVHLALRLPHRTLARLVGARRPSVTTALGQLSSRGAVRRRSDGTWLLTGDAPTQLDGPAPSIERAAANGV